MPWFFCPSHNLHCVQSSLNIKSSDPGGERGGVKGVKEKICGIYLMWKCLHPMTTDRR